MSTDKLQLSVRQAPDVNGFEVRIIISGREPLRSLKLMGMDPDDILRRGELMPLATGRKEVVIGRCRCGEVGCDSVAVYVCQVGNEVIWTSPTSSGRRWPREPIRFDASDYVAEVARATDDRSWETADRTAARLIEDKLDHEALRSAGLTFQWASKYSREGQFSVSLIAEPGPYQVIVHVPWSGESPEVLTERVLGVLTSDPYGWSDVQWLPQYQANPVPPKQAGPRWRQW
jgi:hypothetical protein